MFQCSLKWASRVLKEVELVFVGSFQGFQGCFRVVLRVFQGNCGEFQESFKGDSRELEGT